MNIEADISKIRDYFSEKFDKHGTTPCGLDWNSKESQYIRFDQITKVIDGDEPYTIIDFGCGYGALFDYLKNLNHKFSYLGIEIVEKMIQEGKRIHEEFPNCHFSTRESDQISADYVVESGMLNIKLDIDTKNWSDHVISTINKMNKLAKKGLAFNMLTKYSNPGYMRTNLYYADPCFYFDYCKKNFSKNVALLHDYDLYDFTIIVRKND